jgi:hypothetical protein
MRNKTENARTEFLGLCGRHPMHEVEGVLGNQKFLVERSFDLVLDAALLICCDLIGASVLRGVVDPVRQRSSSDCSAGMGNISPLRSSYSFGAVPVKFLLTLFSICELRYFVSLTPEATSEVAHSRPARARPSSRVYTVDCD